MSIHRQSLRLLAVSTLGCAAVVAACSDDASGPVPVAGTFTLLSTASGPLPYAVSVSELGPYNLVAGSIVFESDSTLVDVRVFQQFDGEHAVADSIEDRRAYRYLRRGDTIFVSRPIAPIELAHVDTGVFADGGLLGLRVHNPYFFNYTPVDLIYQRSDP